MHLIDNVDFITRRSGHIAHILDNFANVANASARSRIHLNDIDMGAIHNGAAMRASFGQSHAGGLHVVGMIIKGAG